MVGGMGNAVRKRHRSPCTPEAEAHGVKFSAPADGERLRKSLFLVGTRTNGSGFTGRFVVAGEREGNAAAILQQRNAPNVKNAIATDAFGSLAGNPADLLDKITGITVDRVGGDTLIGAIEADLGIAHVLAGDRIVDGPGGIRIDRARRRSSCRRIPPCGGGASRRPSPRPGASHSGDPFGSSDSAIAQTASQTG